LFLRRWKLRVLLVRGNNRGPPASLLEGRSSSFGTKKKKKEKAQKNIVTQKIVVLMMLLLTRRFSSSCVRSCSGAPRPLPGVLVQEGRSPRESPARAPTLLFNRSKQRDDFFLLMIFFAVQRGSNIPLRTHTSEKKVQRRFKARKVFGIGRKRVTKRAFGDNICHESTFGDFKKFFFS
jgi:hypothetical protein